MNIKANIFYRKKKELLDEEFKYMILSLQFYVNKKEDLIITYSDDKKEFFLYHTNKFKSKYKDEKIIYILKNWAKMINGDLKDVYNHIFEVLSENSKEEIKKDFLSKINLSNDDFEKFYNDFLLFKDNLIPELVSKKLIEENSFFQTFTESFFHNYYVFENYKNYNLIKMEKYIKKLKYEDIK